MTHTKDYVRLTRKSFYISSSNSWSLVRIDRPTGTISVLDRYWYHRNIGWQSAHYAETLLMADAKYQEELAERFGRDTDAASLTPSQEDEYYAYNYCIGLRP